MSKIKSLKVKQTDGTWSVVDLAAKASNVSYNNISVEDALNNIKLSKSGSTITLTKPDGSTNTITDTNTNTTYSLSKSDLQINLTGSDGTTSSVTYVPYQLWGVSHQKDTATKPTDYFNSNGLIYRGMKYSTTIGLSSDAGTYSTLFGVAPWPNSSGGAAHEIALAGSQSQIYHRSSTGDTTWNNWKVLYDAGNYYLMPTATTDTNGLMSTSDKTKLNTITSDGEKLYFCKTPYFGSSTGKFAYGMGFRIGPSSFGGFNGDTYWLAGDLTGQVAWGTQLNGATGATWYYMVKQNNNRIKRLDWEGESYLACQVDNSLFGINTYASSDERLKNDIAEIDDNVLNAIGEIKLRQFKLKDNNPNNQISFGIIAQEAIEAFEKYDLNIEDYSFIEKLKVKVDEDEEYYIVKYEQWNVLRQAWLERELLNK